MHPKQLIGKAFDFAKPGEDFLGGRGGRSIHIVRTQVLL